MAKIPNIKRLLTEDFPDQKGWIGTLLQPLNQFMEQVSLALNAKLTVADNFAAQVVKVTLKEGATVPATVKTTFSGIPQGVIVSGVRDLDNKGYDGPVGVVWEFLHETSQVRLNQVWGLKASSKGKYELTLYIHGS